ncbi:hypothetical protein [Pasteurella multocida]|uniref:hypothetical protein n=1 Tax=Pasteurella multocida TaxID=747 RepID=UPI001D0FB9F5|nr:hypothetical protein [Pasteurella multocida]
MPGKATLLLEEWEGFFGLPECGRKITGKTLEQRQQQVQEKEMKLARIAVISRRNRTKSRI